MKAKKKRLGTQVQIRAVKERKRHISKTAFLAFILIASISVYLAHSYISRSTQGFQFKAAIVDHLSLTAPNQTFIETANKTLKQAGYTVDYYPGEQVKVEFYRNLPMHGYGLIILRVHSTTGGYPTVVLFTSEPYSKSNYVPEQLTDKIVPVAYSEEDKQRGGGYFGITPSFVKSSMNGKFANTIVVMMGCEGLNNTAMARAFVEKGAKVYISWSAFVTSSHTDQTTTHLLQHFLIEKLTLKEAVRETFKEVGFDPAYKSLLIYYPLEVGEQTIDNIAGNQTAKL